MSRGKRERYFKFFLYCILIVLFNVAGLTLFFRWDLTKHNIYSLSVVSKETVASLSEPLTIKAFFSKDLPPPYNSLERYVRDLLEEYRMQANQHFNYSIINPAPDREQGRQLASSYGIRPMQVEVIKEDELQYKKVYMGMVLIHGDVVETITDVRSLDDVEYKLTSAIEKMKNKVSALLNLENTIKVKLYLSSSLKRIAPKIGLDQLMELPLRLKSIVESLNQENYQKLDFASLDPSTQPGFLVPDRYQLQSLKWPDLEEDGIKGGQGSIGLVLEHGEQVENISLLDVSRLPLIGTQYSLISRERLKTSINNSLQTMLGINQNVGYLTGRGIPGLNRYPGPQQKKDRFSVGAFKSLAEQNYTLQEVNLEQGVPDGLNSLLIAGPTESFSRFELYQLDQALMRGTNLAIFLDGVAEISPPRQQARQQPPQLAPNRTGLETLLRTYGVKLEESLVLDENCFKQRLNQRMGGGERPIYFAPLIKNKHINNTLDFMQNIKGLVALKNSPLEPVQSVIKKHSLELTPLFSSSTRSWTRSENISLNPMWIRPPDSGEEMGSRSLAYLLAGRFPSHFAGQPIPEKKGQTETDGVKKGKEPIEPESGTVSRLRERIGSEGKRLERSKQARILVIGSSDMLSDSVVDAQGKSMNSIFVMNLLDALNNRTGMARLRSKVQQFNPIQETTSSTRMVIKGVNIGVLPVLVLIFGLLVWGARGRRKKQIRMIFEH